MQRLVIATFRGKHNEAKSKVLITLLDSKEKGYGGLTLKEIARESSVSYEYLKSRLGKWYQWKYITRHVTNGSTRPVYSYSIAVRGEAFVNTRIPPEVLYRYTADLREYHNKKLERVKARMAAIINSPPPN
jgi:hypothetical protein